MTSAPLSRAEGARRSVSAGPCDPSAIGVPAAPVAGGRTVARAGLWSASVTAVWLVLAFRSPHVTYHLAPFVAAAAWPVSLRWVIGAPVPLRAAVVAAAGGLAVTLLGVFVLAIRGSLSGPSVWHGSGAAESLLLAVGGTLWGWRAAMRRRPGVLSLVR